MVSWYHTVLLCSRWFMLRYAWGVQRQHGKRHPLRHTCLQCLCIDSNLLHLVLLVTISSPFLLLFIRIKTSAPLLLLLIVRSRCCFNRHFYFFLRTSKVLSFGQCLPGRHSSCHTRTTHAINASVLLLDNIGGELTWNFSVVCCVVMLSLLCSMPRAVSCCLIHVRVCCSH